MKKILIIIVALIFSLPQFSFAQGCSEPDDDSDGIQVFGYIQSQFDYLLDEDTEDRGNFRFERLRLGAMGAIPYDFSYYAVTELSPSKGGAAILDAFITYKRFAPYVKVSVGQFKTPFGLEQGITACHKLHTIYRSQVVNELAGPIRDFGLMFSGGTDTLLGNVKNMIAYQFAIVNGTGLNTLDNNVKKDFLGRISITPVEFLTLGASYRFGKHPPLVTGLDDDERSRYGFDVQLKYKDFLVQGEYISGSDVGSYTTGGGCGGDLELHEGSLDRSGFFGQAMYMTPWGVQPVVKFESYDPNIANVEGEHSNMDIQNIITFGANYFFNENVRLQANYMYKAEEIGDVEIPNDLISVQLQVYFK